MDEKPVVESKDGVRYAVGERFDLVLPEFIESMAQIMHIGAAKYGEYNWQKGLEGNKSGINHAYKHLVEYQKDIPNDYGPREMHLAQVAVNAMFEFYFERNRRLERERVQMEEMRKRVSEKVIETVKAASEYSAAKSKKK